ncbi:MAG: amidohydrolase family protein [Bacteroidales bacterium]|nr:amidohydrolase family protein [Bacteroidales bacterium]
MKYLLIRNCRIPFYNPQEQFSVLIGGSKILQIEKNIMHPAIDTREYDAQGNILIPSLTDTANAFGESQASDDLSKQAISDIESGITTWITPLTTSAIDKNSIAIEHKADHILNYSYHISLNTITRKFDAIRAKLVVLPKGVSSIYCKLSTPFSREALDNVSFLIASAIDLGTTLVFDISRGGTSNEHISGLLSLAQKIESSHKCKVYFLNVCYEEEFDILKRMQDNCLIGAELRYSPILRHSSALKEFTPERFAAILRDNPWCSATISKTPMREYNFVDLPDDYWRRNQLSILRGMLAKQGFTLEELIDVTSARSSKMLGMWPSYGKVEVGADADLIVWNDQSAETVNLRNVSGAEFDVPMQGKIHGVVMNGRVVCDIDGVITNNIEGRFIYRRLLF